VIQAAMAVVYRLHKKYHRDDEANNSSSRIWTDPQDNFDVTVSLPELWEHAVRMAGPLLDELADANVTQISALKALQLKPFVQANILPESLHKQLCNHLWLLEMNIKSLHKSCKQASKKI
jgi:hypothetical protein